MIGFKTLLLAQTFFCYSLFFIAGLILKFFPPKMNKWYGFRTTRALKSEENWDYAQAQSSRYILIITPLFVVFSILIKYLTDFNYLASILYSIIDVLLLIIAVVMIYFLTEDKMKRFKGY